ncbi:hypothetical protein BJ875DRAFT_92248 [Amylocarpus encephaloides]|uniref:Uncharacterized protein n=1 Tax=Amylocarpus encephaloides TaxID=45428 RepID=A0A9P8C356_9HELO|nr:hypothetical protein BJ875DRAFT_92248 [Amylocarpus encephaloides]
MIPSRQTKITDFVRKHDSSPAMFSTPRMAHFKNARSDGNSDLLTPGPGPQSYRDETHAYSVRQRSGSSPQISCMSFVPRNEEQVSPNIPRFAEEYGIRVSPSLCGRRIAETTGLRGRQHQHVTKQFGTPTSSRRAAYEQPISSSRANRPADLQFQQRKQYTAPEASPRHRDAAGPHAHGTNEAYGKHGNGIKAPTDRGRFLIETPSPNLSPPKRSRSPMNKLFGERGFFGQGPDEPTKTNKTELHGLARVQTENDSAPRQKKAGIMDRLKNKFGEITGKADLTPKKSYGSRNDESARVSLLSISLTPPEQARILMEVELMLVHTANSFLMVQFRQGRMSVDSIKKTVDTWKGKGRPTVIEFMYDQATQRDLIAVNEHEFHFHGARAGHIIRIDFMLYNWKQVAALMSVRTFCSTDTVLLKLLFDVEQILELLGAGEATLRVQQIRAKSMELMRVNKTNGQQTENEGEAYNHSNGLGGQSGGSYEDLHAVPDQYREHP